MQDQLEFSGDKKALYNFIWRSYTWRSKSTRFIRTQRSLAWISWCKWWRQWWYSGRLLVNPFCKLLAMSCVVLSCASWQWNSVFLSIDVDFLRLDGIFIFLLPVEIFLEQQQLLRFLDSWSYKLNWLSCWTVVIITCVL